MPAPSRRHTRYQTAASTRVHRNGAHSASTTPDGLWAIGCATIASGMSTTNGIRSLHWLYPDGFQDSACQVTSPTSRSCPSVTLHMLLELQPAAAGVTQVSVVIDRSDTRTR